MEAPSPPPAAEATGRPSHRGRTVLALTVAVLVIAGLFLVGSKSRDRSAPEGTGLDDIFRQTALLRELPILDPIEPEYLSDAELAAAVREEAQKTESTGLPDETLLMALDILAEGTDLREELEESSAAAVIGFYDPATGRLVIESRAGADLTPLAKMTLVHELTHGITDQHFDLDAVVSGDEPSDELSARLGLVEGDATLMMQRWSAEHLSFGDQFSAALESIPDAVGATATGPGLSPVITEIQIAPYVDGLAFVQILYDEGGWDAVNDAYADPPVTTEQVLHPDKYLAGEIGEDLEPPPALSEGATRVVSGQLGELFLRAWLSGGAGALLPGLGGGAEAVDGWDGAVYTAWADDHGLNVALASRWDTATDAGEFDAAVLGWFGDHFGPVRMEGDRRVAGTHCLDLDRAGMTVTLVLNEKGCGV